MTRYLLILAWCCAGYGSLNAQSSAVAFFETTERILIQDRTTEALAAIAAVKADPQDAAWRAFACVLEGTHLTNMVEIEAAQVQFDSVAVLLKALEADNHPNALRIRWEWRYYEGILHMNTQDYPKAVERWDEGIASIQATLGEAAFALVKFYVGSGALYGQSGQIRKGIERLEAAHTITCAQTPIDSFTLANVNLNLGTIYTNVGNAQAAIPHLEQAAAYLERNLGAGYSQTPMALSALGNALTSAGDYARGAQLQERAIQQFIAAFGEEYYYLVYAYYYTYKAHSLAGRYEEALLMVQKGATLAKALFGPLDATFAQLLALQANTLMNIGRTDGVLAMLDTAQHINRTVKVYNTDLAEMVQFSYPRYYTIKGMRQAAIKAYREAIDFLPERPTDNQRSKAVQGWRALGNLYEREQQYDLAQQAHERALLEVRRLQNHNSDWRYNYAQTLLEAAAFYLGRKQQDRVLVLVDTLTAITTPFPSAMSDFIIQTEAFRVEALRNEHPQEAARYLERAMERLQAFRTSTLKASKLAESGHQLYAAGIATYDALDRPDLLYACFEQSHAATVQLKAQERTAQAADGIPAAVLARQKALKAELARIEKAIYLGQDTAGSTLTLQLIEAQSALQQFQAQLQQDHPRYHQLLQTPPVLPLDELQRGLAPDELLLHYHWAPNHQQVARLSITAQSIDLDYLPLTNDLERAIRDIHDLAQSPAIARADRRRALDVARTQAAILLPDLPSHIQRLTILPDGPLYYLPFELLPLGNQYLIERCIVSYRYTASPLQRTPATARPNASLYAFAPVFEEATAPSNLAVVSSRDTTQRALRDGRFVPLRWSEEEVKALGQLFPDATLRLHSAATRTDLQRALTHGYRMIHIASHSFANLFQSRLSGIACAAPSPTEAAGILYAADLYSLSANADLVTLSSCESGLGALKPGEAMLGINHGLLYAGVPHVVSSLWKVNDRLTARFMTQYYSFIAQGEDYATALHHAKVAMIQADVPVSPNVWAAFLLISAD